MTVFATALDALYRAHPEAVAATYTPLTGAPVAVKVIRAVDSVDDSGRFSAGGTVHDRNVIHVRKSQIALPVRGASLTIGSDTLIIDEDPQLDVEGLQWTFGVVPPSA